MLSDVCLAARSGGKTKTLKGLVLWLFTPPCSTVARDLIGVMFLGQGLIRLIDGRFFSTTALQYGSTELYGVVQISIALALLLTRARRLTRIGGAVAAFACAFCVWLILAAWQASATTAYGAMVWAWAMFLEARAWILAEECHE